MDHWRPDCAVFVENEIWPGLLRRADARGIPRLLINASISARSAARWRRLGGFAETLFFGFRWIHVQSAADGRRLETLGAGGILDWGNLKFAAALLPVDEAALAALRGVIAGPVWLAASTHPGEEAVVIAAHEMLRDAFPGLVTVIVPRHPERGVEFAGPRRALGQAPVAGQVYVADTLGELGLFYRLAPFAFVGGTLVDIGGHNISEAGRLGIPVISGPHTREIAAQVAIFNAAGALRVVTDAAGLAAAAAAWLRDPAAAAAAGAAARTGFEGLEGLPARVAARILASSL